MEVGRCLVMKAHHASLKLPDFSDCVGGGRVLSNFKPRSHLLRTACGVFFSSVCPEGQLCLREDLDD